MAKNKYQSLAEASAKSVDEERLRVSYEFIDWEHDAFFFHGIEKQYYKKFFNALNILQNCKEAEITQQKHSSLNPKSIFNNSNSIESSFPRSIVDKLKTKFRVQTSDDGEASAMAQEAISKAFEIAPAKSYGRIHGFVQNKTFYLVWFDPAHQLYPGTGKGKKHRRLPRINSFSPTEFNKIKEEYEKLQIEFDELYEQFANSED